jgi:hypothetical protein
MRNVHRSLLMLILLLLFISAATPNQTHFKEQNAASSQNLIWHVKALHPDGYTLDVKAFDKKGLMYDVKAMQDTTQSYIMDVKAFLGTNQIPVKVLVSEEEYKPVAAIDKNGNVYPIKAIDKNGNFLEVKGVRKSGYIIHIKAVGPDGEFFGVKAISSQGKLNDVKGVKMYDKRLEQTLHGVEIHAHVVALPQIQ